MTDHLLNQTISPEQARLAAYYGRGQVRDEEMAEWARQVADGSLAFSEALDQAVVRHLRDGGDPDLVDDAADRLGKRLSDMAFRIERGLEDAPLAVLRPDMPPSVALGLRIDPEAMLDRDQINALLAGQRADGEKIAGKRYAIERRLPVDPKTGEQRHSTPIGSYDFCPTPDKSVSIAWAFSPPVEQAKILNAHLDAAREAVGYIGTEIGKARIGEGGRNGAEPGHIGWLEFTHHTARRTQFGIDDQGRVTLLQDAIAPGDPDLHTHFLIPNAVFCDSGRVGSLDTAAIGGFIFEADAYYQARLAQNLRQTGFAVELDNQTGAARMPVIPDQVRTAFSKRTAAGELRRVRRQKTVARYGRNCRRAQRDSRMKVATQDREQKVRGGKDDVADAGDWHRQAKAVGWEVPKSFELYGPPSPELNQGAADPAGVPR